jgi:hypothetical protein
VGHSSVNQPFTLRYGSILRRERIEKLAAKICPTSDRSYTLEELC